MMLKGKMKSCGIKKQLHVLIRTVLDTCISLNSLRYERSFVHSDKIGEGKTSFITFNVYVTDENKKTASPCVL